MADQIVNQQNKQTRERVRELMSKQGLEDPVNTIAKREQFLALLKRQYGYTNAKAVDEMQRLLKQFHTMNRSLTFHRPRPIHKQPHAE
jgi:hypothetical protein